MQAFTQDDFFSGYGLSPKSPTPHQRIYLFGFGSLLPAIQFDNVPSLARSVVVVVAGGQELAEEKSCGRLGFAPLVLNPSCLQRPSEPQRELPGPGNLQAVGQDACLLPSNCQISLKPYLGSRKLPCFEGGLTQESAEQKGSSGESWVFT